MVYFTINSINLKRTIIRKEKIKIQKSIKTIEWQYEKRAIKIDNKLM